MSRFSLLVLSTLLVSTALDAAQRIPGPERKVTAARASIAGGFQWITSATAFGGDFLVAWHNRSRYYVSRRDGAPMRIDVPGIPYVANDEVVVWQESDRLLSGRLTATGAVDSRIVLTQLEPGEHVARVVTNGSSIAVALNDSGTEQIRILLLDAEGRLVRDPIDLGSTPGSQVRVAYGVDPGGFVVFNAVWSGGPDPRQDVRGRRITPDGVVADFRIPMGENPVNGIDAAFDGTRYLLALYNEHFSPTPAGTRGVLLSPLGVPQSEIFTIFASPERLNTVVGRNGGSLLFFDAPSGTHVVRLDHTTRTASAPVDAGSNWLDRIVSDGTSVLALWTVYAYTTGSEQHVYGRWLDPNSGAPISDPFTISSGTKEELQPAIALGTDLDLIVWEEAEPSGEHSIAAARVRHHGNVIDATPLRLSIDDIHSVRPAVVFDGENFLVVWCEQDDPRRRAGRLVARRVNQDGAILDAQPIVISDQWSDSPAIAQSGGMTLVVWEGLGARPSTHGPGTEIFGARLTQSGFVLDTVPLLISRDPWDHFDPDIAAGDNQFLVGWKTFQWFGGHTPVLTASSVALVTTGGTVTEPIVLRELARAGTQAPQVAWNGSEFLAAWRMSTQSRAARITRTGALGPGKSVPLPFISDAAFIDGSWHLVSGTQEVYADFVEGGDIHGVYLSSELDVETFAPVVIGAEPMLASNGTRATIVYRRTLPESPHNGATSILFRMYEQVMKLRPRGVRQR